MMRFHDKAVEVVFDTYPARVKSKLMRLRELIFDVAKKTKGVGALEEALRWGQPSYLTSETGSGSTIRIDKVRNEPNKCCIYSVHSSFYQF